VAAWIELQTRTVAAPGVKQRLAAKQFELGVIGLHELLLLWRLMAPALCHYSLSAPRRPAAAKRLRREGGTGMAGRAAHRATLAPQPAQAVPLSPVSASSPRQASRDSMRTARTICGSCRSQILCCVRVLILRNLAIDFAGEIAWRGGSGQ
jgi:hypothetical protein